MWHELILIVALAAVLSVCPKTLWAEDAPPAASGGVQTPAEAMPLIDVDKHELTKEQTENATHKACKARICDIIATRDPNGDNVSCDIVKTWSSEDIAKMLGGKIFWPWGKAVCQSKLKLKRASLAKAMSQPAYGIDMVPQTVRCTLERKNGGEPYVVELSLAPKVKFKDGTATEAAINWGEAKAPALIYPLLYAGTALDNSANILGPEVAHLVNEFVTRNCAAVKAELSPESPN
jgi:hypothetical protein